MISLKKGHIFGTNAQVNKQNVINESVRDHSRKQTQYNNYVKRIYSESILHRYMGRVWKVKICSEKPDDHRVSSENRQLRVCWEIRSSKTFYCQSKILNGGLIKRFMICCCSNATSAVMCSHVCSDRPGVSVGHQSQ